MNERDALLGEVDRFARRVIEPAVARPELPLDGPTLARTLAEAESIGLLSNDEASGLAPWEDLEAPTATLAVLRRLARANAALAFAVHQRALGRALGRSAGLSLRCPIVAAEGSTRLGRTAIARLFAGAPLDELDRSVLADVYAEGAARVIPFDDGVAELITPVFDGAMSFQVHTRDALAIDVRRHAHGLDELPTTIVRPLRAPSARVTADAKTFFAAHQLALVAISAGAVEHAHELARRFASQRRQGGALIDRHPAVLGLLGKTRAVLDSARAQLEVHGRGCDFAAAVGFRAEAQPALADAAHAAMQVFGGIGYMRDTGVEKVARDVNHLRAMAGAPTELAMIAAEWERLHA